MYSRNSQDLKKRENSINNLKNYTQGIWVHAELMSKSRRPDVRTVYRVSPVFIWKLATLASNFIKKLTVLTGETSHLKTHIFKKNTK